MISFYDVVHLMAGLHNSQTIIKLFCAHVTLYPVLTGDTLLNTLIFANREPAAIFLAKRKPDLNISNNKVSFLSHLAYYLFSITKEFQ